jgi:hypothetical protein
MSVTFNYLFVICYKLTDCDPAPLHPPRRQPQELAEQLEVERGSREV